ncbi:DUF4238 domain-containing protein [Brevundimonas nasdae]|uniref:DUF4238 domain-containing protein n=1 Tax=Brevundimonas nasdae TaxID=172043 RepID=A0ABX8TJT1_9CAUL|nr:DUF4238 domain-containing protein [Brevundimonas nasdae]QYC11486.1 DUF4238 domain-containing protein [Brevundimonas nasdae]QYC14274.1 DUF4238 domain-containing protein [Brevundimonas nasdae]
MSGKKQHFIPQSLLRGFATETRKGHRLWVHHRERGVFEANVQDAAAARFFYSELRTEGAPATLDDRITAYESRLAEHLKMLTASPEGMIADDEVAREVVAHLAFRTEATRDLVGEAMITTQRLKAWMATPAVMLAYVGADRDKPGPRIESFLEILRADPRWTRTFGAVKSRHIRKVLFAEVRRDPMRFVGGMMEETRRETEFLLREHRALAREVHTDALSADVVSTASMRRLEGLTWSVADYDNLPLPDTVVLASRDSLNFRGLSWIEAAEQRDVVMPLSRGRLLQGQRDGPRHYDPGTLRYALMRGADAFVINCTQIATFDPSIIGASNAEAFDELITSLTSNILTEPLRRSRPSDTPALTRR